MLGKVTKRNVCASLVYYCRFVECNENMKCVKIKTVSRNLLIRQIQGKCGERKIIKAYSHYLPVDGYNDNVYLTIRC